MQEEPIIKSNHSKKYIKYVCVVKNSANSVLAGFAVCYIMLPFSLKYVLVHMSVVCKLFIELCMHKLVTAELIFSWFIELCLIFSASTE